MWATYLLYVVVTFVSKAVLAGIVCWFLVPAERSCDGCDAETLPVRMGGVGRAASWLTGGRLQRRWCPRCRWEGLTRTGGLPSAEAGDAARRRRALP
jgi:hypothetical protein